MNSWVEGKKLTIKEVQASGNHFLKYITCLSALRLKEGW